jgi:hypothetical protein
VEPVFWHPATEDYAELAGDSQSGLVSKMMMVWQVQCPFAVEIYKGSKGNEKKFDGNGPYFGNSLVFLTLIVFF